MHLNKQTSSKLSGAHVKDSAKKIFAINSNNLVQLPLLNTSINRDFLSALHNLASCYQLWNVVYRSEIHALSSTMAGDIVCIFLKKIKEQLQVKIK